MMITVEWGGKTYQRSGYFLTTVCAWNQHEQCGKIVLPGYWPCSCPCHAEKKGAK